MHVPNGLLRHSEQPRITSQQVPHAPPASGSGSMAWVRYAGVSSFRSRVPGDVEALVPVVSCAPNSWVLLRPRRRRRIGTRPPAGDYRLINARLSPDQAVSWRLPSSVLVACLLEDPLLDQAGECSPGRVSGNPAAFARTFSGRQASRNGASSGSPSFASPAQASSWRRAWVSSSARARLFASSKAPAMVGRRRALRGTVDALIRGRNRGPACAWRGSTRGRETMVGVR